MRTPLCHRQLVIMWLFALIVAVASDAFGQLAPTGEHYAGRTTDTGRGGTSVGATGTFSASIPLDLPTARGGLPVPLQIVYGTRGVGAAGLGWDVPLSYITSDRTFAFRRPSSNPGVLPVPRERTQLVLFGQSLELVPKDNYWVARSGTLELVVRRTAGSWLAHDGNGRTYMFVRPAVFGNTGPWLLKSVSAAGGASVELTYQIVSWPIDGGVGTAIDLIRIAYNTHPTTGCAKHEVGLVYGHGSIKPVSMSVLADKVLVRKNTLTRVDIGSRANCGTTLQRLRRYELEYVPDTDTQLPRLRTVRMFGRQGTAEETVALPIAAYDYGSATRNGVLQYQTTQTIALPTGVATNEVSGTALDSSVNAPVSGDRYAMWQSLTDVTGDGRPDLVFKQNDKLWVAFNRPGPGDTTTLGVGLQAVVQLADSTFSSGAFSTHTTVKRRFDYAPANRNTTNVWRQAIDINGDGRIDIIDAAEQPDRWVVYLNTPGGPTGVKWERRSFSVTRLRQTLVSSGHVIEGPYVPLSRRATGTDIKVFQCWRWDGTQWKWYSQGFANHRCEGVEQQVVDRGPERTFIEWQLVDLNGDGYPDFVFNSSPVDFQMTPPPHTPTPVTGAVWPADVGIGGPLWTSFAPRPTNMVRGSLNVRGVRFDTDHDPFARSFNLFVAASEHGVGEWRCFGEAFHDPCDESVQSQFAGFADVNGDGLVDRVVSNRAYLGAFTGTAVTFSSVYITLPGPMATQRNTHKEQCAANGGQKPTADQTQGLRDLTGDGIPDYYDNGRVWIGTGTGFRPPVNIVTTGANFRFSHETETCDGDKSHTDGGLFDIDGDGRPEVIGLGGNTLIISALVGAQVSGAPEAGRLTELDNGFGAKTTITYVSAKHFTDNPVPFPEIVVDSVATMGMYGLGGTLAGSRYAYSNAELIFDSALDTFSFRGYRRRIEMTLFDASPQDAGAAPSDRLLGAATIFDAWPLPPFSLALNKQQRWLRMQRAGRIRDVLRLRGVDNPDPWSLLNVDPSDPRVIGVDHYEWDAKLYELPQSASQNALDCLEMVAPFDFALSFSSNLGSNGLNICRAHGFAFTASRDSWYGASAPPSNNNIQTLWRVREVDEFGRVRVAEQSGDRFRSDDDVCIESNYATPSAGYARVLTALASRRVINCERSITYAREWWAYDGLPPGVVSAGRVKSHAVERRATDNGALLRTVRRFDATYDNAGNVTSVSTERDGATRTAWFQYDPFGLVPTRTRVGGTGIASRESSTTLNDVSLEALVETDVNQTQRGAEFDGFGRLVRSTIKPPVGQIGVRSGLQYEGFGENDPSGRRIVVKSFPDPVPPANIGSSPGRTTTIFLDELGRERRSEVNLGGDYSNQILVVGAREYDLLGRVAFEADAYLASANPTTRYGTTYHYKRDGQPACFIRGFGRQALSTVPDFATERFPTCFQRSVENHIDTLEVRDAASLQAGTAQNGVIQRIVTSAIGRPIEHVTLKAGVRLDYATFTHDRLGQLTSMTRYGDPVAATMPVQWSWRMDSIGQILRVQEPGAATRNYEYSDWGEMIEARWNDGAIDRRVVRRFDALGRLASAEERNNGVVDPETVVTYTYDVGVVSPHLNAMYVLGRLSRASVPIGEVALGYDAYGNVTSRMFTDSSNKVYVERTEYHADGRLATLDFELPDNNFDIERVKYEYDSADRLRGVSYVSAAGSRELYRAESIDALGRVRKATHGAVTYHAHYTDSGRNLLQEAAVESTQGARRFVFLGYDAVGREEVRREIVNGAANGPKVNIGYDALGRLSSVLRTEGATTLGSRQVTHDALGNILAFGDGLGNLDATLSYDNVDRDRLCRIGYGNAGLGGTACNVLHDAVGNVVSQPTRDGTRQLGYFNSSAIRSIDQQGAHARFRYDPFGQVQELDVTGTGIQDARRDRRFGALIERRDETMGGTTTSIILRRVPGPAGILATRHGTGDDWIFEFGEQRGNRAFTNKDGTFVQDVDYEPFGEAESSGAAAGTASYTSYQWNIGDALAAFGLAQLGARLYDPIIGRFLSRDPLLIPRSGSTTNPYSFAMNDPWNASDPSGLQPPESPQPMTPLLPFDFGSAANPGCLPGLCAQLPPPPPDLWAPAPALHQSPEPVTAPSVTGRRLELWIKESAGLLTTAKASSEFRDFLTNQIYTNQKSTGGVGFCACASRQMALKYAGVIRLGLSYGQIKQGLASETSLHANRPGQWEYWHFNETVKVGGKPMFSHPDKLHPDAIAQIARNASVGTGTTDRLRWMQLTADQARQFLDEGAMVAIGTQLHWLTMIRDPFSGNYVYLDPYADTRADQLLTSRSMTEAPIWGTVLEYHALVHE